MFSRAKPIASATVVTIGAKRTATHAHGKLQAVLR
jgi:hypothetical protein